MTGLKKSVLCIFLLLSVSLLGVGYASVTRNLQISGSVHHTAPTGIYIWNASAGADGSASVNSYVGTNLDSTVTLSESDGADTAEIELTFYNNSQTTYLYDGITYESEAYDNASIVCSTGDPFPIIDAKGYLTLTVTFSYDGGTVAASNVLDSLLHFSFTAATGDTTVKITEGNSSDNINSIHNGSILFGDTSERWTNWAPGNEGRGAVSTLDITFLGAVTFDTVELYHFVDAEGCDFPESVEISYYDDTAGSYVTLASATATKYYKDETRTRQYGYVVYSMSIDNDKNGTFSDITIQSGYNGEMPMTSYDLGTTVTTRVLRLTIDGKDATGSYNGLGYYVGITELMLYNDGVKVDIE